MQTDICIVIEHGVVVGKAAKSDDIKKLNREVVGSVRFRFTEKNFIKKSNLLVKDIKIPQLNTIDSNQTLYQSGEESYLGSIIERQLSTQNSPQISF